MSSPADLLFIFLEIRIFSKNNILTLDFHENSKLAALNEMIIHDYSYQIRFPKNLLDCNFFTKLKNKLVY